MNVTVEIPDDVASRLSAAGGDLSRRALELATSKKSTQFASQETSINAYRQPPGTVASTQN